MLPDSETWMLWNERHPGNWPEKLAACAGVSCLTKEKVRCGKNSQMPDEDGQWNGAHQAGWPDFQIQLYDAKLPCSYESLLGTGHHLPQMGSSLPSPE